MEQSTNNLTRARCGDSNALEVLLQKNIPKLRRHLECKLPLFLRKDLEAEDVVQDTVMCVLKDIGKFEQSEESSFVAWLCKIGDCRMTDSVRRALRKKRGGETKLVTPSSADAEDCLDTLRCSSQSPSREISKREIESELRLALASLPHDYRAALSMRYFHGLSVEAIATQLRRTTGSVRGLLDRGKKQLATSMGTASMYLTAH